jgi:hypothetical protein
MRKLVDLFRRAIGISALQDELRRMSKRLDSLEDHARLETKWRGHFTGKVDALLRHDYLAEFLEADGGPTHLLSQRFKLLSQNEEDGVILALLKLAGAPNRTFVEIGSGASGGNSGMLAQEFGWRGLMVDIDQDKIARARAKFGVNPRVSFEAVAVSPENINSLIERHGLGGEVDLFSLDIDSFDYWVLEAMTACSPRIMALEYNGNFGPERSLAIARDTDMSRAVKGFHGASLKAFTKLAAAKGYKLLACDESGTNAFFVRNDLAPGVDAVSPEIAFRQMRDSGDPLRESFRGPKDLEAIAKERGLRLVEI